MLNSGGDTDRVNCRKDSNFRSSVKYNLISKGKISFTFAKILRNNGSVVFQEWPQKRQF